MELYNKIANITEYAYDYEKISDFNFTEKVDENNIIFYRKLYENILSQDKFKEFLSFNSKEKIFKMKKTKENKGKLRNLLAISFIHNSWPNMNMTQNFSKFFSKKIFKKLFKEDKSRKMLFFSDYFYLFSQASKDNDKRISFAIDKIMNRRENYFRDFIRNLIKKFLKGFVLVYGIYAVLDSLREY